jgi:3-methyl-2-oxobutanoate hydroxymethyltransferase
MSTRPQESDASAGKPKHTVLSLKAKYERGEAITVLTAYDYPTAQAVDAAGVDAILVGDSLAMVVLGLPNTLSLTVDAMLHHAKAVSRGAKRALLIGDMPFMSYQADTAEAVRNAGRFLAEGGMDAVKLEGGTPYVATVKAIVRAGIPVQGHIGLTPQSLNLLGGFRVQGRTAATAKALLDDALALEGAGCFSIVLESVPERLAALITERVSIPTIGIGAGPHTSGQVLVLHDILGLFSTFTPKFAKRYAELGETIRSAAEAYARDVRAHTFPGQEHSYSIPAEEWQSFLSSLGERGPKPAALPRPRRG